MQIEDVIIDDEFRMLLDPLEDLSRLRNKILLEGWSDEPITVWLNHRILLDGHNRYRLWQEQQEAGDDLGAPPIRELAFADRDKARFWVINNQLARRNLSPEKIAYLLGSKYETTKVEHGGDHGERKAAKNPSGHNDHLDSRKPEEKPYAPFSSSASKKKAKDKTAERIAQEHGVAEKTVRRAADYSKALNKLDAEGVVNKSDVLSGRTKIPMNRVIKAATVETPAEAKRVIEAPRSAVPAIEVPAADDSTAAELAGLVGEIRRLAGLFDAISASPAGSHLDLHKAAGLLNQLALVAKGGKRAHVIAADVHLPASLDTPECREATDKWLRHKRKMGRSYKDASSFEGQLKRWEGRSPADYIAAVDYSIAQNYQGLFSEGKSNDRSQRSKAPGAEYRPGNHDREI